MQVDLSVLYGEMRLKKIPVKFVQVNSHPQKISPTHSRKKYSRSHLVLIAYLVNIFSHPLTTVPHSLAYFDGSMMTNNDQKVEFTNLLSSKTNLSHEKDSITFDVDVIDGHNLLENLLEPPKKYGELANAVLKNICDTNAREIHVIFHKDQTPSPADVNMKKPRDLYDNTTINFKINGPNQMRSSSLKSCLLSTSFRNEIAQFLITHWISK